MALIFKACPGMMPGFDQLRINSISYIDEVIYDKTSGTISVRDSKRNDAKKLLAKYRDVQFSTLYTLSGISFERKFGIRYDRRKASQKDTAPMTSAKKRHRRIMNAVHDLKKDGRTLRGSALTEKLHEMTHYPVEIIEQTISENTDLEGVRNDDKEFAEYYLSCAGNGEEHAEFENLTRMIFTRMGFETKKQKIPKNGSGKREIDGLILNKDPCLSGLLECKGGAKYTFPVGDCSKMADPYIEHFRKKRIGGKTYDLDFFVYVVGQRASGLGNFREIVSKTGVRGSVIYARDLFKLYCLFRQGKINPIKIWSIFKGSKHLTWSDVDEAAKN